MKASLDTNAIIHFYRANLQGILFQFFDELLIYEQIRNIELANHGQDILSQVDSDIQTKKIRVYTDQSLRLQGVLKLFEEHVKENRLLYSPKDLGEVYAISLAQTLGVQALVTDDTKQGGPYMSLMQFEDEVKPFHFADILILRYLMGMADATQTVADFDCINRMSDMRWSLEKQLKKFIRRFWRDPYCESDRVWMDELVKTHNIDIAKRFFELRKIL